MSRGRSLCALPWSSSEPRDACSSSRRTKPGDSVTSTTGPVSHRTRCRSWSPSTNGATSSNALRGRLWRRLHDHHRHERRSAFDYEPTPADNAEFTDADLVVMNGLDYDHWAEDAIDTLVVRPAGGERWRGRRSARGRQPAHLVRTELRGPGGAAVTAELKSLAPDAADYFDAQADCLAASMKPYNDEIASIRQQHAGTLVRRDRVCVRVHGRRGRAGGPDAAGLSERRRPTSPSRRRATSARSSEALAVRPDDRADLQLADRGRGDGAAPRRRARMRMCRSSRSPRPCRPARLSFVAWQLGQLEALAAALGS